MPSTILNVRSAAIATRVQGSRAGLVGEGYGATVRLQGAVRARSVQHSKIWTVLRGAIARRSSMGTIVVTPFSNRISARAHQSPPKVFPFFVESLQHSRFLVSRASCRKTASHCSGNSLCPVDQTPIENRQVDACAAEDVFRACREEIA